MMLGPYEMAMVGAAIVALVLGPKKLPELAGALGESKKEYKKSMAEAKEFAEEASPDVESEIKDVK